MTVRQLLDSIDSRELSEWQAFYEIDPWGDQRADLRNGVLCALIHAAHRGRSDTARKPADFMVFPEGGPKRGPTPDELLGKARLINLMFGGDDVAGH